MQADYIYPKFQKMVSFNESMYKNLAQMLISAIGNGEFFNGSVEMDFEDFHSTLKTTLIIYREKECPDRSEVSSGPSDGRITDVIPVWWELSTTSVSGIINNDFSWRELRKYLF